MSNNRHKELNKIQTELNKLVYGFMPKTDINEIIRLGNEGFN